MTSVLRSVAQIPENKLYIATSTFNLRTETDAEGTSVTNGAVMRDMGKSVIFNAENPMTSYVIRKVQVVNAANDGAVGYIRIGGQTYGGNGTASAVALLN